MRGHFIKSSSAHTQKEAQRNKGRWETQRTSCLPALFPGLSRACPHERREAQKHNGRRGNTNYRLKAQTCSPRVFPRTTTRTSQWDRALNTLWNGQVGERREQRVSAYGYAIHGTVTMNNSGLYQTGIFRSGIKRRERERTS